MSLLNKYKELVDNELISYDDNQFRVLEKFQELKTLLEEQPRFCFKAKLIRLLKSFTSNYEQLKHSLYIYSGVGRGKTMLMDIFYNNLNIPESYKYRTHFHLFMKTIHQQMQNVSGFRDPIDYIVKNKFSNYKIICLDEFMVHDIADAMILAKLLEALIKYNIILVTTSNIKPDDLYKNGLQRSAFVPAIKLINANYQVILLEGQHDYRVRILEESSRFIYPMNEVNLSKFKCIFNKLSNFNLDNTVSSVDKGVIEINSRPIKFQALQDFIIWFDFVDICSSFRANTDYVEIAEIYKTIFISNLPALDDYKLDSTRRFINIIDILYDYKVVVVILSHVELNNIYIGKKLEFEFERTTSRLLEMQSKSYLEYVHI